MPIYEYSCEKCGKKVELLQKMGAESAGAPCPACGADALKKQLSVTSPAKMAAGSAPACAMPNHQGPCGGCCGGCH
ncbi:FmdB family zinc ribbon protein [Anaeroselena agilis]|uniref:Zinc ribbon domain-containing protein n=1 Tax=Anaeroselena agilis TaxID=3063788 RepID=A0ABU3P4M9_9FIRM|nr:zinc ribbon domain-containing protein [Selenomonadales bacterium 4137-cl]